MGACFWGARSRSAGMHDFRRGVSGGVEPPAPRWNPVGVWGCYVRYCGCNSRPAEILMSAERYYAAYRFVTKGLNPLVDPFPLERLQRLIRKMREAEQRAKKA